jgi:hypothetical protein
VPAVPPSAYGEELPLAVQAGTVAIIRKVRKRVFLRHFVRKTMIFIKTGSGQTLGKLKTRDAFSDRSAGTEARKTHLESTGAKPVFVSTFYATNHRLTKAGSGHT